jgi:exo-beta-1,3-glucanase (GH17 family)
MGISVRKAKAWDEVRGGRRSRRNQPCLEGLEDRLILSTASSPVLSALTTYRYWTDYAPSYNATSDPYNANPSDAHITSDLKALYSEGWRGLVTYTILGSYADIPKIAKSVGFRWVIAGVYDPTNATEVANASSPNVLPYADAYVVGNEGLTDDRYTDTQLTAAIGTVKQATDKPVSTSEPGGAYYSGSPYARQLLGLGDWLFPNIDYFLWGGQPSTPQFMWTNVSFVYQYMEQNQTTPGPVVAKEVFYPTAGGAQASDANQIAWYGSEAVPNLVNGQPFYFVWGEAFDQPWKYTINAYEPHMGLHLTNNPDGTGQPKPIISQLQADFTRTYGPSTPTPTPTPPILKGEMPLTSGKGARKRIRGDELFFTAPLDSASAQNRGHYHVTQKIGKKRVLTVPVRSATYDPADNAITIILARSRRDEVVHLTVTGLAGADGLPVAALTMTI